MQVTMNKYITILLLMLSTLSLGTPAYADFEKGLDAYQREDYATAFKEWKLAADQGDADAQNGLGGMYGIGLGVTQDYKEALKWYRLAAEQGDANAQWVLGVKYQYGKGVIQDYKEAVKWYRLGAEQGDARGQYNLGRMYELGNGVAQDYTRAHMWLNISASQANADATKSRDKLAKEMTPEDISKAQGMARECVAKNYKGC
jgi:TPR repeat protein